MNALVRFANAAQNCLDRVRVADFFGPLALRLYLVPIFWMAGTSKIDFATFRPYSGTIEWFASIGIPFPGLNAFLAGWTEVLGAIFLLLGLATRWISIPLMCTMVVAMVTVHWQNGWLAIAEGGGLFATERTMAAAEHLAQARDILQKYGDYDSLTEFGSLVVLNNGIEFAATYLIMLLVLFFSGGGRHLSLDYWIARRFRRN